jgi:phosphoribosylanthranilate isomerase
VLQPIFPANGLRPIVKICGITHPGDAELAIELGADALGLNFYPGSSRCLNGARDAGWMRALPSSVPRIAVLVNPSRSEIDRLVGEGFADAVQLHGDEDEAFCAALAEDGVPFIKALRLRDDAVLEAPERFHSADLLLDSYRPGAYGGTGETADWQLAARFSTLHRAAHRILLSGGLNPENVAEAIRPVRPDGVDVASGVEGAAGPRRKDAGRLREFFAAVNGCGSGS